MPATTPCSVAVVGVIFHAIAYNRQAKERLAQARRLKALVEQVARPGDRLVVCGDFNVEPEMAPNTIGRSVSHGCVRLRNEDIETLYRMIPVGAAVYIY